MKLMKERGSMESPYSVDIKESEINRIKAKQPESAKKLSKVSIELSCRRGSMMAGIQHP